MVVDFLEDNALPLGAISVGVSIYLLTRKKSVKSGLVPSRQVLVMYQADGNGSPEFRRKAIEIAGWYGAQAIPVTSGAEIIAAIRRSGALKRILWFGHGTPRAFFRPGHSGVRANAQDSRMVKSIRTVARALAPHLASGWILGLAGCSAAAGVGEFVAAETSRLTGGASSFAALLRDELVRAHAPLGVVRGHTTIGHTTRNPNGREFLANLANIQNNGVGATGLTHGGVAERWIAGLV